MQFVLFAAIPAVFGTGVAVSGTGEITGVALKQIPLSPFGNRFPPTQLLEESLSTFANLVMRNSTKPIQVMLDRQTAMLIDKSKSTPVVVKNISLHDSHPVTGDRASQSLSESSVLASLFEMPDGLHADSLHVASTKLTADGFPLLSTLAEMSARSWDRFRGHVIGNAASEHDLELAHDDLSELGYQLNTLGNLVKQANEEFTHKQLHTLLQVRAAETTVPSPTAGKLNPVWGGKLKDLFGPGLGKPNPAPSVTEATLDYDINYHGPISSDEDPTLANPPWSMSQRSMYGIFHDLIEAVDDKWLYLPQNSAYMDSYLFNIQKDGTNSQLPMGKTGGYNWYQSEQVDPNKKAVSQTFDDLQTKVKSVDKASLSMPDQKSALLQTKKAKDPKFIAISLAQGLVVHSELAQLQQSIEGIGSYLGRIGGQGTVPDAIRLYDGLGQQVHTAQESLQRVAKILFDQSGDLPKPHPTF